MRKIFILQVSSKAKIIMLKCKDIAVILNCKIVLLVKTALLEFQAMAVTNIVVNIISTKRGMSDL